jgi:hypothetical protein
LAVGLAVVAVTVVNVGLAVTPAPAKTLEEHGRAEGKVWEVGRRQAGRNMS